MTNGFENEADGPLPFEHSNNEDKTLFYDTAKFSDREILDMEIKSISSVCADEEAHLPTINQFNQTNKM